jgi:hypothetical protein
LTIFPVFFRELAREGAIGRECALEMRQRGESAQSISDRPRHRASRRPFARVARSPEWDNPVKPLTEYLSSKGDRRGGPCRTVPFCPIFSHFGCQCRRSRYRAWVFTWARRDV